MADPRLGADLRQGDPTERKRRLRPSPATDERVEFGDSPRQPDAQDFRIADFLRKLRAGELPATEPDPEPPLPPCQVCQGFQWLRRDLPRTDPEFGRSIPCPSCKAPIIRQRVLDAIWRAAEIPLDYLPYTFDTFRRTRGDLGACGRVEEWAASGEGSLYLSGKQRRGKTSLGLSAMRHRINVRQVDALYVPAVELMGRIRDTYNRREGDPTEGEVVASVTGVGLLLIDDIGTNAPTAHVEEMLYRIINRRQIDRKPTIFTSNLTLQELGRQIGARIALRIRRMCGPAHIVRVEGPDLDDDEDEL